MRRLFLVVILGLALSPFALAQAQTRNGGLDVQAFCARNGYPQVTIVNNGNDWVCLSASRQYTLTSNDLTLACQLQYGAGAFAVRDGTSPIPAHNWSCYGAQAIPQGDGLPVPVPTAIPPTPLPVAPVGSNVGRVIGELTARTGVNVNVRTGPGTQFAIVGKLVSNNATFALLGQDGDWYAIDFGGRVGYVSRHWTNIRLY